MLIDCKNKAGHFLGSYNIMIKYYYHSINGIDSAVFSTTESFEEFMSECHPGVSIDGVIAKFGKKVEFLAKLCSDCVWNEMYRFSYVYCYIAGDILVSCMSSVGIQEKVAEYYETNKKVHEGYLHMFLANEWSYSDKSTTYVTLTYYFDPENTDKVFKIYVFKDKIVIEDSNPNIASIIVTDKFWVNYGGKKRPK